jgi:hypothetical protein
MRTIAITRRENNPDTRSISDHTKPTSNPTKLDDSDAVNASSIDGRDRSESTGQALVTSSNLATATLLSWKGELLCPNGVSLDLLLTIKIEGSLQELLSHLRDAASQQHLSSEGIQAQPTIQEKEDIGPKGGLSRTKKNNLYTTFAFLVDAFYKIASDKYGEDKPSVLNIAKHLEDLATKANNGEPLPGQGDEAIKDRIEEALEVKRSKLPQR